MTKNTYTSTFKYADMTEKLYTYLRVLILFNFIIFLCIIPTIAKTSNDYWAPWVTKTTTNSATINWRGESDGLGSIEYATSSYFNKHHKFEKNLTTSIATQYQHVSLTGLEPNTSYTYWVKPTGNEYAFGNRTFQTMPVSGPFTFIVISDSQEGHNYTEMERFRYVAEAIAKEKNVLFILHGGDYAGHDSKDLWKIFSHAGDEMLAKFSIFPTIGNHEYHNSSGDTPTAANQFHWAFDMPLNYSFDCVGIRFIILNTPDPNNANGDDPQTSLALAQSQESWLSEQLSNETLLGVFTIHHHPIWDYYNTTANPNLAPWETLYHNYNITATFAGHTHNYQRYSIKGIPYFIVGNAGGRCADLTGNSSPAGYKFGMNKTLGYLKVTVDPVNNTATTQEIFVAHVNEDDDDETPMVYNPPVIADTITFPLKANASPILSKANIEKIDMGNSQIVAYESRSATNNITPEISQGS